MGEQLISEKGKIERMAFGVKGLDENMQGGFPRGSTILMCGAAGTMKSSLSATMIKLLVAIEASL